MLNPINAGDTAWVLVCCSLVLLMTPALRSFTGEWSAGKTFFPL